MFIVFSLFSSSLFAAPRRVVSLLPSHSEIVVALGAGDTLVGVSDVERSGDFAAVPRVGGLVPRWEVLVALTPDVILADSAHERFGPDFKRFNLPAQFFPATHAKTIEDVFVLIKEIGRMVDREPKALALVAHLQKQVAELDAAVPSGTRPRAFFEIWSQPLQGVAPGNLQGHLMKRAGFENIVPETWNEMPLLSSEWVAGARPDVIFHTGLTSANHIAGRSGWKRIPAVQTQRIILLNADLFSRAGPRVVEALAELHRIREAVKK